MTHIHNYYIWCPLTQETRIYMYLVHGWGLNRFQDFFFNQFFVSGESGPPPGLMTYIPIEVSSHMEQEYTLFREKNPNRF